MYIMEDRRVNGGILPEGNLDIQIVPSHPEEIVTSDYEPPHSQTQAFQIDPELAEALTDEDGNEAEAVVDPFDQVGTDHRSESTETEEEHLYNIVNREVAPLIDGAFHGESRTSKDALGLLWAKITPILRGHYSLSRFDEDTKNDFIQDTFVKVYKVWGKGTYKNDNFMGWCTRIMTNVVIDKYRRSKVITEDSTDAMEDGLNPLNQLEAPDNVEESTVATDAMAQLYAALRELTKNYAGKDGEKAPDWADVLHMIFVEGYSYEAYAELRGVDLGTVKSRVSRARKKAITILAEQGITRAQ